MCSMMLVLLSCALADEQIVVNCLVDDIQDNTIWESLQYMTSHLVYDFAFVSCSVLVRYSDNCAPIIVLLKVLLTVPVVEGSVL